MSDEFNLIARGLDKSYPSGEAGRQTVLAGADLAVGRGESVGLCGASGAGKSTLLHLLGGLDRPDGGVVEIDGINIHKLSAAAAGRFRNRRLGFVYQFHHLLGEFSALENAALPLLARRTPRRAAYRRAGEILAQVGLADHLHKPPAKLSGGERQRAAIARALAANPACVIADEPTGNLDRQTASRVFDLLLQMNDELGVALIVATHDPAIAARLSRRYDLIDGKLCAA